jgi:hypothetical protein
MNGRFREWLLAVVLPVLLFAIFRSLSASWYSVDLSGIPDEGQVPTSLLPWFLYSYNSGGGVWSDAMRARTWLFSCAGYLLPAFLAAFASRRKSTRACAVLLLGGLVIWAALAIPTPPLQASYYTPTTVARARLWIVALTLTGAVVGFLVRRLGHVGAPSSSPDRP